jgi:hypothetical protein
MSASKNDNGNITTKVSLAVITNDLQYLKQEIRDIKDSVTGSYVTKEEFSPVKKIVYGLVSVILLAVGGALINLIIE